MTTPQTSEPELATVQCLVANDLSGVSAKEWNSLVSDDYPFLRYEFLRALERHDCVGERFGWLPQHLLARDAAGVLQGAAPLYLKFNSYGEFVFDWSWADAYERTGGHYYPKLVGASPYTPATGPKLLTAQTAPVGTAELLAKAGLKHAQRLGVSSLHWLFPPADQLEHFEGYGLERRMGCQFHWRNPGYRSFDEFLATFTAAKRKSVRRERRRVVEQGVRLVRLSGQDASESDWAVFHRLYESTFDKRGGTPTLSLGFFMELAEQAPESVLLVLAYDGPKIVAAAFDLVGSRSLYGRHWGCFAEYHSLHFEACYYQGQDFCIERGLERFEPGAQGEHKISRGFLPTATWSTHWIADRRFGDAITRFLHAEIEHMETYIEAMQGRSPYRQGDPAA